MNTICSMKSQTSSKIRYTIRRIIAKKYLRHVKGSVLDVGCGNGEYISKSGIMYHGIEGNSDTVQRAKIKGINIKCGDARKLPYPDDSFDTVTCFHLLEHLPDGEKVIKEVYRVLKPNGKFILILPDKRTYDIFHEHGHIVFWNKEKTTSCLSSNGFTINESYDNPTINIRKIEALADILRKEQVFICTK